MSVSNTYPPIPDWNTQQDTSHDRPKSQIQGIGKLERHNTPKKLLAVSAIIAILTIGAVGWVYRHEVALLISTQLSTKSPQASFEVTISNTRFLVPGPYLHRVEYGTQAKATKAYLILPWRKGPPTDDQTYIISATLQAQNELTSQALFQRVFKPFLAGPPKAFGLGMKVYSFKPGSPYSSEKLYERTTAKGTQFARCLTIPGTPQNGHCQARILVANGVVLRYRFAGNLLSDWPQIDMGLTAFINTLKVNTDKTGK